MKFFQGKKTYIGLLVAAVPMIAGAFGYNLTTEGATELGDLLVNVLTEFEELITAGGLLFAAYGRKVTKG